MRPRQTIGQTVCPVCNERVPLTEQANGYAMIVCPWCNAKLQSYGKKSDEIMRQRAGIQPAASQDKSAPEKVPEAPPPKRPNPANPPARPGLLGAINSLLSEGG